MTCARPPGWRGAILGDFLEEVVVDVKEEREPAGERIDFEACSDRGLDVRDAVGDRRYASSCAAVAAASRMWYPEIENGIPIRDFTAGKLKNLPGYRIDPRGG